MPDQDRSAEAQFLYLTTTGRRTGLPREIEIWFVSSAGNYDILSGNLHHAQWVKNIKQDPRVRVRVGPRAFEATARVLTARRLSQAKYGWGDGLPVEFTPLSPSRISPPG
ncbi:MAG: nitroreductase family deazaflavin-dependent oxidoreductase, partial [Armatimonadetes bacterium]|nr:nitroreductase family deazaflavin-dependent oxidoreductase [Armatimonadota bacterium]